MDTTTYSQDGKETGKITLPDAVFGAAWNANLVHQVVISMQSNARAGTAHTKFRGEVAGGGKKPWKQKGTGRARHGSSRSPIWAGGGVAHGPRVEKDYSRKINANTKKKAFAVVLSKKFADGETIFLDALSFAAPKAKDARAIMVNLGAIAQTLPTKRKNAALIVLTGRDASVEKSFQNFGNVLVRQLKDVNPVDLLTYKYVIFAHAEASVKQLTARVNVKSTK